MTLLKRLKRLNLLFLAGFLFFLPSLAQATTVQVNSQTLVWYDSPVGQSVWLEYVYQEDGIDSGGNPHRRGEIAFRVECTVTLISSVPTLTIPTHNIESTVDFVRPGNQTYSLYFVLPNRRKVPWRDFQTQAVSQLTPQTFGMISIFNSGAGGQRDDESVYTKAESDFRYLTNSLSNPMTTSGDIIYGGTVSSGKAAPTRLQLGTTGYFLKAGVSAPVYAALTSGEVTTALGFTPINGSVLNASNLNTGTIPDERFPSTLPVLNGSNLTNISAGNLVGTLPAISGVNLTNLNGSNVSTGTVAAARIADLSATYFSLAGSPTLTGTVKHNNTSSVFSGPDTASFHPYQVTPTRAGFAFRGGPYNVSGAGNIFQTSSYVENSGTTPTVGMFGEALGSGQGSQPFGGNFVAVVDVSSGTTITPGIGAELNIDILGSSGYQRGYGLVIAGVGDADTPTNANDGYPGVIQNYIQMQVSTPLIANSRARNGIVFSLTSSTQPIYGDINNGDGAFMRTSGLTANYLWNATSMQLIYGFDFAASTISNAAIRIPNNQAGIVFVNAANTLNLSAMKINSLDQLMIGETNIAKTMIDSNYTAVHGFRVDITATKTSTYTVSLSDSTIRVDTSAGGFTLNLPDAASCQGQIFTIKMVGTGSNVCTLDPFSTQTIDGASTNTSLNAQYENVRIQSDGSNFLVIGSNY